MSPKSRRVERIAQRQHVGREAQLEIHRSDELPFTADREDPARIGEVATHRLLDEHRRPDRQMLEHRCDMLRRNRDIEDCVGRRGSLVE